jgi:hypothetical protein
MGHTRSPKLCIRSCSATETLLPSREQHLAPPATGGPCLPRCPGRLIIRSPVLSSVVPPTGISRPRTGSSDRPALVMTHRVNSCSVSTARQCATQASPTNKWQRFRVGQRRTASNPTSGRCWPTPTASCWNRGGCPRRCSIRCATSSPMWKSSSSPASPRCLRCTPYWPRRSASSSMTSTSASSKSRTRRATSLASTPRRPQRSSSTSAVCSPRCGTIPGVNS